MWIVPDNKDFRSGQAYRRGGAIGYLEERYGSQL